MRSHGEFVDLLAGEALQRRDQIGTDALRDEMGGEIGFGILRPGAAVGADRDARHRFDATGNDQVLPVGADFLRREVDRFQAGAAKTIELKPGRLPVPAGCERRRLADATALLAIGRNAADHHVVDLAGIQIVATGKRVQRTCEQIDRLDVVQGAARFAATARRANCIENHGFGHGGLPDRVEGGRARAMCSACSS